VDDAVAVTLTARLTPRSPPCCLARPIFFRWQPPVLGSRSSRSVASAWAGWSKRIALAPPCSRLSAAAKRLLGGARIEGPRPLIPALACGPGVWDLRLELRLLAITFTGTSLGAAYWVSIPLGPSRLLLAGSGNLATARGFHTVVPIPSRRGWLTAIHHLLHSTRLGRSLPHTAAGRASSTPAQGRGRAPGLSWGHQGHRWQRLTVRASSSGSEPNAFEVSGAAAARIALAPAWPVNQGRGHASGKRVALWGNWWDTKVSRRRTRPLSRARGSCQQRQTGPGWRRHHQGGRRHAAKPAAHGLAAVHCSSRCRSGRQKRGQAAIEQLLMLRGSRAAAGPETISATIWTSCSPLLPGHTRGNWESQGLEPLQRPRNRAQACSRFCRPRKLVRPARQPLQQPGTSWSELHWPAAPVREAQFPTTFQPIRPSTVSTGRGRLAG